MIYSRTSGYAIRALGFMASQPLDQPLDIQVMAKACRISPAYLAKIFQALTRARIVKSQRGAGGGFLFRKDPSTLALLTVIQVTDDPKQSPLVKCVMGLDQCNDKNPCLIHPEWKRLTHHVEEKFSRNTIKDVSALVNYRMAPVRKGGLLSKRMKAVFSL